jgi:hypothetical protein
MEQEPQSVLVFSRDMTFAETLDTLYKTRHTGPIVIHFAQGHPNSIEVPCEPQRIRLTKVG